MTENLSLGSPLNVFRGEQRLPVFLLLFAVGAIATIAWGVTALTGESMSSSMMASMVASGDPSMFSFFLLVWGVMMVAMMFPTSAPMIQAYVHLSAEKGERHPWRTARSTVFLGTYIGIWAATGLAAGGAYLLLGRFLAGFTTSGLFPPLAGGGVLIAAGIYQASPLKETCLHGCRSPITFLLTGWRPGLRGAVELGARHAIYCIGCCWMLFAVLFVVGVMAIGWMALLTAMIFFEKLFIGRAGLIVSSGIGGCLAAVGIAVLVVPAWAATVAGL